MRCFVPEGVLMDTAKNRAAIADVEALRAAALRQDVLEARAVLCDSEHDLHIDLPCMEGVIPHEEGAIGIEDGSVRDIALLSRVGKPVCFTVQDIVVGPNGCPTALLSRRKAQLLCREQFLSKLRIGDVVSARVTRLESFGAFCDIGCGLVALLPIACMSVSRISHPRDRVAVGEMLWCVVTSLEAGRICLSMRELLGTWEENAALFSQGETVLGVVRSVEPYGVFVELTPNLAGLAEPHAGARVGQTASVFIKSILPDKMKIKLVIIDTGEPEPTPIPLRYFSEQTHIARWDYAPSGSRRRIGSAFCPTT